MLPSSSPAFALVASSSAQRGNRRQQPRGGRQDTGYAAPPADAGYAAPSDAVPAYGDYDAAQDEYVVTSPKPFWIFLTIN